MSYPFDISKVSDGIKRILDEITTDGCNIEPTSQGTLFRITEKGQAVGQINIDHGTSNYVRRRYDHGWCVISVVLNGEDDYKFVCWWLRFGAR